jgi:hypothetical protein
VSAALSLPVPDAVPEAGQAVDLVVRRIHRGEIRTGTVRTGLPAAMAGQSWWEPGPVRQHTSAAVDAVADVVSRCAPWLRVYVGPALWQMMPEGRDPSEYREVRRLPDGKLAARIAGQAWSEIGALLVATAHLSMTGVVDTVHHEVWHAVEHRLSPTAWSVVDSAVAAGRGYPSAYLDSALERRARLYAAWACAVDEGLPTIVDTRSGLPMGEVESVFAHVYSGRLAAAVAAANEAAAAPPRPGLLRRLVGSGSQTTNKRSAP